MQLVLVRHGATAGNVAKRYVGSIDEALCAAGHDTAIALGRELSRAGISPEIVYVSPLQRARQTARLCFPHALQHVVPGLAEMNFGTFEGRTADEMADDAAYQHWIGTMCEAACPQGESRALFCERVLQAFERTVREVAARGDDQIVIVAHGGTIMAIMDAFAEPSRPYFDWYTAHCTGYCAELLTDCAGKDAPMRICGVSAIGADGINCTG